MSAATPRADATLKIITTVAMKGVLDEIAPEFARTHGHGLTMTFGPGGITLERVRSGQICDVVISAPGTLDTLTQEKYLLPGSTAIVARSRVGVAVRAGAPKPKIDTVEDFKRALLAAQSIGYSNPVTGAASGVHFVKIMERLGITDAINAKAKLGGGGPVAELIVRGEVELAIQQICEHMLVKGIDVVGPVPNELQLVTTLGAALHERATSPDTGKAFIQLLTSPRIQERLQAHGLEPAA